jgi:hypothetical protein
MQKPSVKYSLLAAMIAKHRWGSPIGREYLLSVSPIEQNEYPNARDVFKELRSATYITNRGNRGIELDTSEFGALADVLYHECLWEPFEIKSRLKHYEGWNSHEWA